MRHVMKTVEHGKKYAGRLEAYSKSDGPLVVLEYTLEFRFSIGEDKPDVQFPDGLALARFLWLLAVVKNGQPVKLSDGEHYGLCTFLVPRAIAYYTEPDNSVRRKALATTLHQQAAPREMPIFGTPVEEIDFDSQGYPHISMAAWYMLEHLFNI